MAEVSRQQEKDFILVAHLQKRRQAAFGMVSRRRRAII